MEEIFKVFAQTSAMVIETMAVMMVLVGSLLALAPIARLIARGTAGHGLGDSVRVIWRHFAAWILLALEFALGADIIRSAIAPTWDDVGKLAAIAGIRTFLSYFLDRDIESVRTLVHPTEIGPDVPEKR